MRIQLATVGAPDGFALFVEVPEGTTEFTIQNATGAGASSGTGSAPTGGPPPEDVGDGAQPHPDHGGFDTSGTPMQTADTVLPTTSTPPGAAVASPGDPDQLGTPNPPGDQVAAVDNSPEAAEAAAAAAAAGEPLTPADQSPGEQPAAPVETPEVQVANGEGQQQGGAATTPAADNPPATPGEPVVGGPDVALPPAGDEPATVGVSDPAPVEPEPLPVEPAPAGTKATPGQIAQAMIELGVDADSSGDLTTEELNSYLADHGLEPVTPEEHAAVAPAAPQE